MRKSIYILVVFGLTATGLFFMGGNTLDQAGPAEKMDRTSHERADEHETTHEIKDGDIIFQTSLSDQSKAIQLATNSTYSHCGIIYRESGNLYVFEAVQPIKMTPLDTWIERGKDAHYVIKRLRDADQILTPEIHQKMKQEGERFKGKDYDLTFEWSDDKIYCSELIWKIYKRAAGIEIGKLGKLKDFDLTDKLVKQKMYERYGNEIPLNETVISPSSIFNSELLITVLHN